MTNFTPLTMDAVRTFYGVAPPHTVRGYAVLVDGQIEIVFGICRDHRCWVVFADMSKALRERIKTIAVKKIIVRCSKLLRELLATVHIPVVVGAEKGIPEAGAMLEHFGYKQLNGGIYQWPT